MRSVSARTYSLHKLRTPHVLNVGTHRKTLSISGMYMKINLLLRTPLVMKVHVKGEEIHTCTTGIQQSLYMQADMNALFQETLGTLSHRRHPVSAPWKKIVFHIGKWMNSKKLIAYVTMEALYCLTVDKDS